MNITSKLMHLLCRHCPFYTEATAELFDAEASAELFNAEETAELSRRLAECRKALSNILNRGCFGEEATLFRHLIDLVEILGGRRQKEMNHGTGN